MDMNIGVIVVLSAIIIAQMGLIYGLLDRLVRQSGQAKFKPTGTLLDEPVHRDTAKIAKPHVVAGSQKVSF